MRPAPSAVAPVKGLVAALGLDALVSCVTRLAMKRWRYCLIVFMLIAIPVLVLQWVMLEEERAKYTGARVFGDSNNNLFSRNWATSGTIPELLSRALRYCNMPISFGAEGPSKLNQSLRSMASLRLLAAYVVVRHGDRAPLWEYPNFRYSLGCDIRVLRQRRDELLDEMVEVLLRTPVQQRGTFANRVPFPNETTCSRGRMTPQGVLQNFLLGSHLFNAYRVLIDDLGLPGDVQVLVTHSDRTFHSAVALLQALFRKHPGRRQLPEFHVASNVVFCNPRKHDCSCPKLRLYFSETKVALSKIVSAKEIAGLRYAFGKFLGADSEENLPNLEDLLDAMMPLVCHKYREPICAGSRCLTHMMVHELWKAHDRTGQSLAHELSVIRFCKLAMFPFLKELLGRMKAVGRGRRKEPRFVLFSGHDLTVRYLLTSLGLYDGSWPPLSSRVVFELYSLAREEGGEKRFFRLLYNGEVLTTVLPFCREEVCALEKFGRFLKEDYWLPFGTSKPCM